MEPEEQRRFEAGGKARAFLESKARARDQTAQAFHSSPPGFRISIKTAAGERHMGEIDDKGKMQWDEHALQSDFQCTVGVMDAELRAFRSG